MNQSDEERFVRALYDEHLERHSSVLLIVHNLTIGNGLLSTLAEMYPPSNGRKNQLQYGPHRIGLRTLDTVESSQGFRGVMIFDPDIYILNRGSAIAMERLARIEEMAAHVTRQEILRRYKEKYG